MSYTTFAPRLHAQTLVGPTSEAPQTLLKMLPSSWEVNFPALYKQHLMRRLLAFLGRPNHRGLVRVRFGGRGVLCHDVAPAGAGALAHRGKLLLRQAVHFVLLETLAPNCVRHTQRHLALNATSSDAALLPIEIGAPPAAPFQLSHSVLAIVESHQLRADWARQRCAGSCAHVHRRGRRRRGSGGALRAFDHRSIGALELRDRRQLI